MVEANYYTGQSSRQQAVTLRFAHGLLQVCGENLLREVPPGALRISAKLGNTPRLVHFADGGFCEVSDHAAFEALLAEAGLTPLSLLSRLESHWRHALLATLTTVAVAVAAFQWGLPWFAEQVAAQVPAALAADLDVRILAAIDEGLVQGSTLSAARQQDLQKRFNALKGGNDQPRPITFRNSKTVGANAFALPGGTIVVTDQLVALAGNDEEILGVLAHELGHVSERHPLRQLLQSSAVGLAATWYLGDVSSLLTIAPTLLLESRYSRDFEQRADHYAATLLRNNGIPPARLADILEKLEVAHLGAKDKTAASSGIGEFLSSHPDTGKRISALRGEGARP